MGLPGVQGQTGEPGHKGANGEKGFEKGSSGESGNVPVIVFRARNVSPDSDLSGTVIRFSNVDINSGSGYDKSTGKFTAPQAGTYLFILQICPEDNHSVLMTLRANNDKFGILNQKNNHDDGPCTSTSAITVLSEGEEVWVYCESASSGDSVWNANENGNSFSGVLIHTGTV
ncbi:unnamed protein product [Mytilus coruscus]|uniref:C1q domain-containing protein n=1 Tax=Mytilus coruscus TaxID=42192 RepID=A0A6J8DE31_MYTCO|nr:unnamed protein product [Mytilus coruscus]